MRSVFQKQKRKKWDVFGKIHWLFGGEQFNLERSSGKFNLDVPRQDVIEKEWVFFFNQRCKLCKVNHVRIVFEIVNLLKLSIANKYMRLIQNTCSTVTLAEENLHLFLALNRLPLTVSYNLFRFLIGSYSVAEIQYSIKKRNANDKNTFFFLWKTNKKQTKEMLM